MPRVVPIAKKIVAEHGLTDRVEVIAVDVVNESLPGTYDAAVLHNFLQVLSADNAQKAVRNIAAAILAVKSTLSVRCLMTRELHQWNL